MTEKTGSLIGSYSCGSKGWFFLSFIVKRICRQSKRFISDQGEIAGCRIRDTALQESCEKPMIRDD